MFEPIKPKWFKPLAWLAVIWNLLGVMAFVMHVMTPADVINQMPEAEQALYNSYPTWALSAFAIAVFAGFLGSMGLALCKTWANFMLWCSLLGLVAQNIHSFLLSNSLEVYGLQAAIMPAVVFIIAIALIMMGRHAARFGWLR